MNKRFIFVIGLLFSLSAFSQSQFSNQVAIVKSDIDDTVTALIAHTDMNGTFLSFTQRVQLNGKVQRERSMTLAQLRSGAALSEREGQDVVTIQFSARFEPIYGGPLKIIFLQNGITGRRGDIDLDFIREGNRWILKRNGRVASVLTVKANRMLSKVIGIQSITF
jgi:hypothetical protein